MKRVLITPSLCAVFAGASVNADATVDITCMDHKEFVAFILNEATHRDAVVAYLQGPQSDVFPEMSDDAFFAFMMNLPSDGPLEPVGPDAQ